VNRIWAVAGRYAPTTVGQGLPFQPTTPVKKIAHFSDIQAQKNLRKNETNVGHPLSPATHFHHFASSDFAAPQQGKY